MKLKKSIVLLLVVLLLLPMTALARVSTEEIANALCIEINLARAVGGVKVLPTERFLDEAADRFARAQAERDKMGHASTEDLRALLMHSYTVGENVGYYSGPNDARKIAAKLVDAWKNSPSHHENLMREDDTAIGIGVAYGASGRVYVSYLTGKAFADAKERPMVEQSARQALEGAMPDLPYSEIPGDDPQEMRAITGPGYIVYGFNRDLDGAVRLRVDPVEGKSGASKVVMVDANDRVVKAKGLVRVYAKVPANAVRPIVMRMDGKTVHFVEVPGTNYIWFTAVL